MSETKKYGNSLERGAEADLPYGSALTPEENILRHAIAIDALGRGARRAGRRAIGAVESSISAHASARVQALGQAPSRHAEGDQDVGE